ncbi:MAG: urease subunit alpha, partial [Rhodocyclaceae bacterium]|nr:urease subunit alpha [Rhodocyclaceae bacterium]
MFGAFGGALETALTFVSQASMADGRLDHLKLARPLSAVRGVRSVTKADMVHNDWLPKLEVDSETYEVRADGQLLTCDPAAELPLAQRYFLF